MSPASPLFRGLTIVLALAFGVGAISPEVALLALSPYVLSSRTPVATVAAVRVLLGVASGLVGLIALGWQRFWLTAGAAIAWVIDLSPRGFWSFVIGFGCVARLLVALCLPYQARGDAWWYGEAARALARGEGLSIDGALTAYRPPLYPLLLSLTERLGVGDGSAWIWGGCATVAMVCAVSRISGQLYGRSVARLATLIVAVYPALVLQTGQAMSDLPFAAGSLIFALLLLRAGSHAPSHAILLGVALGLLTLTRGVALGLFVVPPTVWLIQRIAVKRVVTSFAVLLATLSLALSPWMVRNYLVFGRAALSTNVGVNALIGNHPGASGGYGVSETALWPRTAALNEADADQLLLREAVGFVTSRPLEAVMTLPRKLLHLFLLETSAATALFQGDQARPPWVKYGLYGVTQMCYVPLLVLFLARLLEITTRRNLPRGPGWMPWIFVGYFTLVTLVFFGQDRFRLPILPWMVIEGSAVLVRLRNASPSSR